MTWSLSHTFEEYGGSLITSAESWAACCQDVFILFHWIYTRFLESVLSLDPKPCATHQTLVSLNVTVSGTLGSWNLFIFTPLTGLLHFPSCVPSSVIFSVFCINFFLFQPDAISLCAYTASALSVHLSVDRAAVAVNSGVLKFLGHRGVPFLTFCCSFYTVLALSAAHKSSGLSSSSSIFVTSCFSGHHHPNRYKVILWIWFLVSRLLGTLSINSVPNMVLSCHGVVSGHYTSTQAEPADVHGIRAYGCRGGEANKQDKGSWKMRASRLKG